MLNKFCVARLPQMGQGASPLDCRSFLRDCSHATHPTNTLVFVLNNAIANNTNTAFDVKRDRPSQDLSSPPIIFQAFKGHPSHPSRRPTSTPQTDIL
ncbi:MULTISPECIES: hypothetical protein [unclassified Microcoleus]|uniref:hypothetical protein n=1 Tax=unclassified Microcoleus TaxID=2642155 RepID=UPI001DAA4918|nr:MULTISPECIES: hypothetical protein [unclassified Microcoleus]MCC3474349.1 hypothetical protein [Microcoleus sp. PH2017_13_LAR_U_A]MCC3484402.1 hypothetical protein [Microcoleus sp. PH2017_14_LAR_D_A]MCC3599230.1 hypothetical protein [Microcoleus sp. PH2017_26_ELK_O_A]MCC3624259.1 hypothetical protein [Microcoleus sp. PH2017_36_ELK_O_B]